VTVDGLTAKLEKMFTIAEKNEQVAGCVSAVLGMAKLHDLITDKVAHSDMMSPREALDAAKLHSLGQVPAAPINNSKVEEYRDGKTRVKKRCS
jgi:hypothetical protein